MFQPTLSHLHIIPHHPLPPPQNVLTMIAMTADPAGNVSQRARRGLIAAVSKATFAVARCGSERGGGGEG